MICGTASRCLPLKGFLSQARSSRLIAVVSAVLMLVVPLPAFAQRGGGGHGGGGGHWGGGGHIGGGHSGGGWSRGATRGGESWTGAQSHSDIVVVSGTGARNSARIRSFAAGRELRGIPGASREMDEGAAEFTHPEQSRSELDEFESSTAPRHVMIGFPPDAHTWNRSAFPDRAAPVDFAGQGDAVWQTSPGRGAGRSPNERPIQISDHEGVWRIRIGRSDHGPGFDRDGFFPRRFHRRFFSGGPFGLYSYPFRGYGLGLFSYCPDWLSPDWEWQEYYTAECNTYTDLDSQNAAVVADGADQNYSASQSYDAPQADTQRIYEQSVEQNPAATAAQQRGSSETGNGWAAVDTATGSPDPDTLIYFADGTNYAVTNYWLADGDLHYVTSYGAEDSVPIGRVDLQRTVDANATEGVQFTLRPAPDPDTSGSER